MKTYIIHTSEYAFRGEQPSMRSFRGTFRQLLEELSNITEENNDEEVAHLTDANLLAIFEEGNGDGQPFYSVWCVEDDKQVIGGTE